VCVCACVYVCVNYSARLSCGALSLHAFDTKLNHITRAQHAAGQKKNLSAIIDYCFLLRLNVHAHDHYLLVYLSFIMIMIMYLFTIYNYLHIYLLFVFYNYLPA